jgi:hypothetical protein
MARCSRLGCGRWRPDVLARLGRAGVSFDGAWYCATACLTTHTERLLSRTEPRRDVPPAGRALRIGTLLVHHKVVGLDDVQRALREQRTSGLRLGAQIVALGLATPEEILRALAAQAGMGYLTSLDPSRVADGCAGLPPEAVRALGVVPFELRDGEQRLRVACTAPVPRMALASLREMTGLGVEPFLVTDETFNVLLAAYGAGRRVPGASAAPVRSISDAARHIAHAAERKHADRMQQTRCDPYVWIRLDGHRGAQDFVLSIDHRPKESPWLEEPTSH